MRTIDIHSHLVPQALWRALALGKDWYGARYEKNAQGQDFLVVRGVRNGPEPEEVRWTTEQRLKKMDAIGTDVHVVSVSPRLFNYDLPEEPATAAAREVNDEIAGMVKQRPKRFGGLATLPLPHVKAAVAEMERARKLGHLGAMVNTHILGRNWDEPEFEPIFRAAQDMDAVLFFHPDQPLVGQRISRYHLGNTSGNVLEDSLTIAVIIFSGLLDKYPRLKLVVAHGGGPIAFGIDRMDRGWEVRPEARVNIPKNPPSSYLRRFYVDDITWGEASLRFLIDRIGSDRVVLGSDWPYDMGPDNPVQMLTSMESITKDEKERILHGNLEELLGI